MQKKDKNGKTLTVKQQDLQFENQMRDKENSNIKIELASVAGLILSVIGTGISLFHAKWSMMIIFILLLLAIIYIFGESVKELLKAMHNNAK